MTTFSGAGGSSTGYRMAGYDVVAAVDSWRPACESYRHNWPGSLVVEADMRTLDPEDILNRTGIAPGELDLLDGSPSCQGFSTAGKRDSGDPRNQLFREFVRLLAHAKPHAFIMENVPGAARGPMRRAYNEMTAALAGCGYRISCRFLDASWLGVPQERKRLVWIGARRDTGRAPAHPFPAWRPVSLADALADFGQPIPVGIRNQMHENGWRSPLDPSPSIIGVPPRVLGHVQGKGHAQRVRSPDEPAPTVGAMRPPMLVIDDGRNRNRPTSRPSLTIGSRKPEYENGHGVIMRQLTTRECARLQTFPDWYTFAGNEGDVQTQIGNAVPPLMAAQIGIAVARGIFGRDKEGWPRIP